jgi:hypothetical protein
MLFLQTNCEHNNGSQIPTLDQHPIYKETDSTEQSYTQNQKLHNFLFPKLQFPTTHVGEKGGTKNH